MQSAVEVNYDIVNIKLLQTQPVNSNRLYASTELATIFAGDKSNPTDALLMLKWMSYSG